MYFITTAEDNGLEARLARLEAELEAMRAEIEALRVLPAKPAGGSADRREYMREYMRRKRNATAAGGGGMPDR